jgi:hypothetical protein
VLVICTWLWGNKYTLADVWRLKRGVFRHLKQSHRFMVMTERERDPFHLSGVERHAIKDPSLTQVDGCFCRLRMFDYGWQKNRDIDDRLVCIDLDAVMTGPLDPLFDRPETFVILAGANSVNPCPFNGSVMMLRPGNHGEVWSKFSLEAARTTPFYKFPDDQGWLATRLPKAATWRVGTQSGIYAFKKPGWPAGDALPSDARMVVFPGARSPLAFSRLEWIKKHWV